MKPVPIINAKDIDPAFFQARKLGSDVHDAVSSILDAVKEHGDNALKEMAAKYGFDISKRDWIQHIWF